MRERQLAILERIKILGGFKSHRALALALGIGYASYWRIREGESETLNESNLKKIYKFLDISQEEFASYLNGETSLDYACRNLVRANPEAEVKRSKGALKVFREEVLPYLLVPEMLEALRVLQARLFAWLPDYTINKRPMPENTRRISRNFGIPETKVNEAFNKLRELREVTHAQIPEADLIIAAHDLEIDVEVMYQLHQLFLEGIDEECKAGGGA